MSRNASDKYYKGNKKETKKNTCKRYQSFSKEEQEKTIIRS